MTRLHRATRRLTRRTPRAETTTRRTGGVPNHAAQLAILVSFAGVAAALLLAITIYAFYRDPPLVKDLLAFTKYLAGVVLLWAVGPKLWSRLLGGAKALTKTEEQ